MSKTIVESTYNKDAKLLSLVFGWDVEKVYTYKNVPPKTGNGLVKANSKGSYFHAHIRDKFEFQSEYK